MNRRDFMQLSGMAALSGLTPAWPALAGAAGTEAPGVAPVDRDRHIRQFIPDFLDDYVRQMAFPLSFADHPFPDFEAWKREARAKSLELIWNPKGGNYSPPGKCRGGLPALIQPDFNETVGALSC